jgi:hypothetical protein
MMNYIAKNAMNVFLLPLGGMLALLAVSCVTVGPTSSSPVSSVAPAAMAPDEYAGNGRGANLQKAINVAQIDVLRKASIDIIGEDAVARKQASLERSIYTLAALDQYLRQDTLKKLSANNVGSVDNPDWMVEISVVVKRSALEQALASLDAPAQASVAESEARVNSISVAAKVPAVESLPSGPTPAQKAFVSKYVDKLTYLVYFNEKTIEKDLFPLKSAVAMANSWLSGQGLDVASGAQVEKLKKDRQMVYEEQSGDQASIIQWVSQSLNADVYLEIDARIARESRGGNVYSQATVAIQMYETSTGQLLGGTPAIPGPQRMSGIDQTDADSKALQDAVYNLMPRVLEQSRSLLGKQYANGIKYQLVIQKASDPDVIADFRNALKRQANVTDVLTRSESENEVLIDVFMYGRIDDLGDTIRTVRSTVNGLEKMRQIQKRGKTLIFDSGM